MVQSPTRLGSALLLASFSVLLGAGLSSGCTEKPPDDLRNCDVPAIFASSCNGTGCHGSKYNRGNLDLVSPGVDQRLFHVTSTKECGERKLVVPGHPEQSLLYNKISEDDPLCGDAMPIGPALSKSELACIRDYIERAGTDVEVENCETCGSILCADLMKDPLNCGGCDQVCDVGQNCIEGQCSNPCEEEEALCGASCVLLEGNDDHCGACDHRCGPGSSCQAGVCACDDSDLGAGGATSGESTGPLSFAEDILPLLDNSCSGSKCHTEEDREAPLGLDPDDAYSHLVDAQAEGCENATLVVPGNPDESYLLNKLLGGSVCDGAQMPLADKPLPDAATARFVRWICDGAPNN